MSIFTTKDLMDLINVAEFAVMFEEQALSDLPNDADTKEQRVERRKRLDRWRKTISDARSGVLQR